MSQLERQGGRGGPREIRVLTPPLLSMLNEHFLNTSCGPGPGLGVETDPAMNKASTELKLRNPVWDEEGTCRMGHAVVGREGRGEAPESHAGSKTVPQKRCCTSWSARAARIGQVGGREEQPTESPRREGRSAEAGNSSRCCTQGRPAQLCVPGSVPPLHRMLGPPGNPFPVPPLTDDAPGPAIPGAFHGLRLLILTTTQAGGCYHHPPARGDKSAEKLLHGLEG